MNSFAWLALSAGAAIAIQAAMNARLGFLLSNPLLAACVAFVASAFFTVVGLVAQSKSLPSSELVGAVPVYLWFGGGILAAFGISMFYFLIPKMGIGSMMSFALTGQLLMAVIAGHFGWFGLAEKPVNLIKIVGVVALIAGVVLINKD